MTWFRYPKILQTLALNLFKIYQYVSFEKLYGKLLHSVFHPISRHLKGSLEKLIGCCLFLQPTSWCHVGYFPLLLSTFEFVAAVEYRSTEDYTGLAST